MPLQVNCPRCHCPFTFPAVTRTTTAKCSTCGQVFTIQPAATPTVPLPTEVVTAQLVAPAPGPLLVRPPAAPTEAWPAYANHEAPRQPGPRPRRRRKDEPEGGSRTVVVVLAVGGAVFAAALLFGVGMAGVWLMARSAPPPAKQPAMQASDDEDDNPIQQAPQWPDPEAGPMLPPPGAQAPLMPEQPGAGPGAPGFGPAGPMLPPPGPGLPGGRQVGPPPGMGPGAGPRLGPRQPLGPPIRPRR